MTESAYTMFRKALFGVSDAFAWIGGLLVLIMMVHVVLDVTLRFFGIPLKATIEIVQAWYMIPLAFLPLAYVEKVDGHIAVELLSQHLGRRAQDVLIALVSLLCAIYFAGFALRTGEDAIGKYKVGELALGDVAIIVWPTRFALPLGCGLIAIFLVYKAICLFRKDRSILEQKHGEDLLKE